MEPGDAGERCDVEKCCWETLDDDDDVELIYRCSSALDDVTLPLTSSADIAACEPIQWRPVPDVVVDELCGSGDKEVASASDMERGTGTKDTKDELDAVCDVVVTRPASGGTLDTDPTDPSNYDDHLDAPVSWSATFPQQEPEVDSPASVGKRTVAHRRSRRREKVYGVKRRRRSPHPSSIYQLSVPRPPALWQSKPRTPGLWQPWQDNHSSQVSPLQTALENLRSLSMMTSTSSNQTPSTAPASGTALYFISVRRCLRL